MVDLEEALGQYAIYQLFLRQKDPERQLYLAVPRHALDNILSREVGRVAIEGLKVSVLVYSLTEEEQLQWKPQ